MNFYTEGQIIILLTTGPVNVWDKGLLRIKHDFSNSMDNLKLTFSYLNCNTKSISSTEVSGDY